MKKKVFLFICILVVLVSTNVYGGLADDFESGVIDPDVNLIVYNPPGKMNVGETMYLNIDYNDFFDYISYSPIYTSLNTDVVEIDSDGYISAVSAGQAEIIVTVHNERYTFDIEVSDPVKTRNTIFGVVVFALCIYASFKGN